MQILMLGTFPGPQTPNKGVFNARSVELLSDSIYVNVISIRTWKPGRNLIVVEDHIKYKVFHLHIPHHPSDNSINHWIATIIITWFISHFLKHVISNSYVIHSVGGMYGILGAILSRKFSKPHLLQLTGSDIYSELPQLKNLSYVKNLPKHTNIIVGNNKQLVTDFNKLFKTNFITNCIYRGVNLKNFEYQPLNHSKKILYVGGLDVYRGMKHGINTKGGISLMNAWKIVEKDLKKANIKLLFGGPNSDCTTFNKWRSELLYPEQVELVGYINPEKIKDYYYLADAIIIPSMEEGTPNVAFEASACGRPVIASDTGGLPEIIEHLNSGLIFPAGNDIALSECLGTLSLKWDILDDYGKNARNKMELHYDHKQYSESYLNFYYKLCAE